MGRADHDDAVGDDRGRVQPHLGQRAQVLIHVLLEIDQSVLAESGQPAPGLGVQSDELVARCDIEDDPVAAVIPVGQSSS